MKKIIIALATLTLSAGLAVHAEAAAKKDKVVHTAPYLDAKGNCHATTANGGGFIDKTNCAAGDKATPYIDAGGKCHGPKGYVSADQCKGLKADSTAAKADAKADSKKDTTVAKADAKADKTKAAATDKTVKADAAATKTKTDAKADAKKAKADAKADAKKKKADAKADAKSKPAT